MRKPFEIGDKVIRISGTKEVFTVIGKTLSGQPIIQMGKYCAVIHMHDPHMWEHYVETKVGYLNIHRNGGYALHPSREEANRYHGRNCIACIKVTYKEGQFDD